MRVSGQSLPEYTLAIALVTVVALAGLTPLGKTLFDHFSSMGGQAKTINGSLSATSGSGPMPLGTNFSSQASGAITAGGGTVIGNTSLSNTTTAGTYQGITATLKNGTKLNLGQYPANPANMVETAGISGTTNYIVGVLQSIAHQLLSTGSVTPQQYNSLINLSNRGHDIGSVQSQIEVIMGNNGGSLNGMIQHPITIAGQSTYLADSEQLTVKQALQSSGCIGNNPNDEGLNLNQVSSVQLITLSDGIPSLHNNFIVAYNLAKSDGSLNDPIVKQIVDDLAFKIILSGEVVEDLLPENNQNNMLSNLKSVYTHHNSKGICNQGKALTAVFNATDSKARYVPTICVYQHFI